MDIAERIKEKSLKRREKRSDNNPPLKEKNQKKTNHSHNPFVERRNENPRDKHKIPRMKKYEREGKKQQILREKTS